MKYLLLFLCSHVIYAQVKTATLVPVHADVNQTQRNTIAVQNDEALDNTMTLSEFLGYVKKFHPIVKQANLIIAESDAKRMKARGVFDPKLELDYATKQFKSKDYYNKLNTTFKIPVWYGIDLKANYENNEGYYVNPENTTPANGLFGLGLTASLNNMFMSERMAAVKQAKNYQKQALEEQKILVNKILFDAANTYFDWLQYYNELKLHKSFLQNSQVRFSAIKNSFKAGEMAAIDTLESNITVNNRKLNLEKANVKYIKYSRLLSNYLWLENNIPVEINSNIFPDTLTIDKIDVSLNTASTQTNTFDVAEHPKLKALGYKAKNLELDRKLKLNKLLPKIDAQYNLLTETFDDNTTLGLQNYKAGVKVSIPIFLRKERSDLELAKIKIEALNYESLTQKTALQNKIYALQQELISFEKQLNISTILVRDYEVLSYAEQRKFILGESSVFYVNIRESKLMEAELKNIKLRNDFFKTKAKLYNSLVIY